MLEKLRKRGRPTAALSEGDQSALRQRKVTIWPRVQVLPGEKVLSVVPVVMPSCAAQRMAFRKGESALTSVKGSAAPSTAGLPAAR